MGAAGGGCVNGPPYLYVGPGALGAGRGARPGPADDWNGPFGAVLSPAEIASSADPVDRAATFLLAGIGHLRGK